MQILLNMWTPILLMVLSITRGLLYWYKAIDVVLTDEEFEIHLSPDRYCAPGLMVCAPGLILLVTIDTPLLPGVL